MTFYFFDLETSGFRAREDRIMQFAGQRTDMDLKPVGKPDNLLIKLSDDILPQPDAVLVHGISPQKTIAEGINEAELCKYLTNQVFVEDTVAVGYNNIRFDNEFIRFTLWRNFYDAYEWSWKNGRSTWDLLDVTRMTRALRPDGIKWPFDADGRPSNKLELLAAVNKLEHANAHDALSDVMAVIDLARLLKAKQPKLFDYLLEHRGKDKVAPLVSSGKPFIYTSGRYPGDWQKTTIAVSAADHPDRAAALVYDLRIDPEQFKDLSPAQLAKRWGDRDKDAPYFPVKQLVYNRCPAVVGDLRVLDEVSQKRLELHMEIIEAHLAELQQLAGFGDKLVKALEIINRPYQAEMVTDEAKVDGALYDGFVGAADKSKMRVVRAADAADLADLQLNFADERLGYLLPLYKARNYPSSLNDQEQAWWQKFRQRKLLDGGDKSPAANYLKRLDELSATAGLSSAKKHLVEDLRLYAESIIPLD